MRKRDKVEGKEIKKEVGTKKRICKEKRKRKYT
jgi:hypothetical protein